MGVGRAVGKAAESTRSTVRDADAQKQIVDDAVTRYAASTSSSPPPVSRGGGRCISSRREWQRVQDINLTGTFCRRERATSHDQPARRIDHHRASVGGSRCEGGSTTTRRRAVWFDLTKNLPTIGRLGIRANRSARFHRTPLFRRSTAPSISEVREPRAKHKLGRFGRPKDCGCGLFLRVRRQLVRDGGCPARRRRLHGRPLYASRT